MTHPTSKLEQILKAKGVSREQQVEVLGLVREVQRRAKRKRFWTYYPDEGPLRRELYPKHLRFFEAGRTSNLRAILAANRVGKSEGIGAFEITCHATGRYPKWWRGHRFDTHAPVIWVSGKTNIKTRDIIQRKLLGPITDLGTGMIPGEDLVVESKRLKQGTPNAVEQIEVKHAAGAKSLIVFKSYAEERRSFEGEEIDVIWLDEEPPLDIYSECLIRVMSTRPGRPEGHILCTFTPLEGMSEVVMNFMPEGRLPDEDGLVLGSKFVIMATWEDVPHLSAETKKKMLAEIPPYQRDARSKGIPQLGAGAIYPISEEDVVVDDFEIPPYYKRCLGLDYGWNWTACVWGAIDPSLTSDTVYITSCYKRGHAEPAVHAAAINARGDWIPGVADPAGGTSQADGKKLLSQYQAMLGNLYPAENAVEAGLFAVWSMLSAGKLKVFRSCRQWFEEFRLYRRDEKGKVVKINDHLMDATRYLVMSGLKYAVEPPDPDEDNQIVYGYRETFGRGTGRSAVTGY